MYKTRETGRNYIDTFAFSFKKYRHTDHLRYICQIWMFPKCPNFEMNSTSSNCESFSEVFKMLSNSGDLLSRLQETRGCFFLIKRLFHTRFTDDVSGYFDCRVLICLGTLHGLDIVFTMFLPLPGFWPSNLTGERAALPFLHEGSWLQTQRPRARFQVFHDWQKKKSCLAKKKHFQNTLIEWAMT